MTSTVSSSRSSSCAPVGCTRWRRSPGGVSAGSRFPQEYFIKLAGRLGLLTALTDLMVDRACAQLADWSTRLHRDDLRVCVNVPPGLMTDQDFPRRVAMHAEAAWPRRRRLILEITEDALIGETGAAGPVADRLRGHGSSALAGRFRHRLLVVAEPAADLPAGGQDRYRICRQHSHRSRSRAFSPCPAGAGPRSRSGWSSRKASSRRNRQRPAVTRLRARAGLPLRTPAPAAGFDDLLGPRAAPKTPPTPRRRSGPTATTGRTANGVNGGKRSPTPARPVIRRPRLGRHS